MKIKVDILETEKVEYAKHIHKKSTGVKKGDGYLINVFRCTTDGIEYGFIVVPNGKIIKLPLDQLKISDASYLS